ncbi:MAG: SPOR domain-containing protein, partial [Treponema sp.]|nr:SPOR domain-containing protein [Treponema sp.]
MVVISAALLVFRPGGAQETSMSYRQINGEPGRSATTDPAELIRDDSFRGLQNPDAVSPIYSTNGESAGAAQTPEQAGETGAATVISVPKPTAAAVPTAPAKPAAPAPVKPKAAAPAPKAETPAPAAAPRQRYRDFWVQAGSFSTRERADGVKHILDDKGISAVITNQDINGNTYYRVRIGPYTSQNEADYWLAMIKSIDG